ncbi:MAG: DNA mismatch repair endonuclease MutL [Aerococcus sp.]|nr:DNA mismatch repair endonuclease MutL [Aerococcus sp.]
MHVHELPAQVANQIAAGEVVERPASVVKELLENAIDAEAKTITITVSEAGMKQIQVVDDGIGMSHDDAVLAFKRHATSKILTSRDLFKIKTLGFRGEALPSIASVSEMILETSDGEEGTFLSLSDGAIVDDHPTILRQGTRVLVENLFYNTPARLKYVKSLNTELAHITDIVTREALGHPEIAFHYEHEGRLLLQTNGKNQQQEVLASVYGVKTARDMTHIHHETLDFTIDGYIAPPDTTRASKNYISIFLNGRYIKNYTLNQAVIKGYQSKLMVGRYPIAVIDIELDAQLLDVNVHPTKQEVRISKEPELYEAIQSAIREVLQPMQRIPKALDKTPFAWKEEEAVEQGALDFKQARSEAENTATGFEVAEDAPKVSEEERGVYPKKKIDGLNPTPESTIEDKQIAMGEDAPMNEDSLTAANQPTQEDAPPATSASERTTTSTSGDHSMFNPKQTTRNPSFPELDYVGQLQATYLITSDGENMYMVDQHAAQERIKYEYFREIIGDYGLERQSLLVPIVLDYPPAEYEKISQAQDKIKDMGIELESFGPTSFAIHEHPAWMASGHVERDIQDLIELAITDPEASVASYLESTAIMMSCRLSIKANHYLDDRQAKQLLHDLAFCENPYNCPHGRPVLIRFTNYEIERMFKRIQDPHVSKFNQHLH